MKDMYNMEAVDFGTPYRLEEEGIRIKLTLVITGQSFIHQRVPYELFLHILRDKTFTVKRLIAKNFTTEEWDDIENRIIPKARQWLSRGVHSIEIPIPDLFLWNRIGQFISEYGKIQGWLK